MSTDEQNNTGISSTRYLPRTDLPLKVGETIAAVIQNGSLSDAAQKYLFATLDQQQAKVCAVAASGDFNSPEMQERITKLQQEVARLQHRFSVKNVQVVGISGNLTPEQQAFAQNILNDIRSHTAQNPTQTAALPPQAPKGPSIG